METRPPLPPFTGESARLKVRLAEDAWNTRDPEVCARVYTEDTRWRNRAEFPVGREEVKAFLRRKWARELDYRLIKELWAVQGHRIAVHVTSSNSPRFDVNPNTGENPGPNVTMRVAKNTVFLGGARASAIRLPVIYLTDDGA